MYFLLLVRAILFQFIVWYYHDVYITLVSITVIKEMFKGIGDTVSISILI